MNPRIRHGWALLAALCMPAFAESFSLAPLPYPHDALQPVIDTQTMQIHHGRHHKAYVDNLNKAIADNAALQGRSLEQLLAKVSEAPMAVRNNGGGHWNHTFFWGLMGQNAGGAPTGALAEAINKAFGSFEEFKAKFEAAGLARFGSGWAWLCVKADKSLCICSTPNQDNPLMTGVAECTGTPILGCDVWEHAYYLNYQNRRADYLKAWWNAVNWSAVEKHLAAA